MMRTAAREMYDSVKMATTQSSAAAPKSCRASPSVAADSMSPTEEQRGKILTCSEGTRDMGTFEDVHNCDLCFNLKPSRVGNTNQTACMVWPIPRCTEVGRVDSVNY